MKVNFEIKDSMALIFKGAYFDLHNNFDFSHFAYTVDSQLLVLTWLKSGENWAINEQVSKLAIIHKAVSFLSVTARDPAYPLSDDTCLADITYFPSSERHMNDRTTDQPVPDFDDDLLYIFQSGQTIRVNCDEV